VACDHDASLPERESPTISDAVIEGEIVGKTYGEFALAKG